MARLLPLQHKKPIHGCFFIGSTFRQGQIRAASSPVDLPFVTNPDQNASMKNVQLEVGGNQGREAILFDIGRSKCPAFISMRLIRLHRSNTFADSG